MGNTVGSLSEAQLMQLQDLHVKQGRKSGLVIRHPRVEGVSLNG